MNTAVVIYIISALVGVAVFVLAVEWFRTESRRIDAMVRDALEDSDVSDWENEMSPSQSPLFDDDGWLR